MTKVSLYLYIEVHVDPVVVHGSFGYVVKEARDAVYDAVYDASRAAPKFG